MTSGAIDHGAFALQVFDVFQKIVVNSAHHLRHVARSLLRGLVILFPLVDDVTVSTVNPERAAVAKPHYVEHAPGGHPFEKLNVLKNRFSRFVLATRDLLSQFSKFRLLIEPLVRRSSLSSDCFQSLKTENLRPEQARRGLLD